MLLYCYKLTFTWGM